MAENVKLPQDIDAESNEDIDIKELDKLTEEGSTASRDLKGLCGNIYLIIGVAMAIFHIYFLGYSTITPWILCYVHLCFGLILTFMIYPFSKKSGNNLTTPDLFFITLSVATTAYFVINMDTIIYRIGIESTTWDIFFCSLLVLLVLEITRRTNGIILPLIAVIFILYALYGNYLPPEFGGHRGYSFSRAISYMTGMDAMLSTPLSTSASFVFLFILFSAFLNGTGAGQFFIDMALSATGTFRGGPAKTAVIASALFGTVSGNSAGNVMATGTFTIPLMRKVGYNPAFAGAVEAVASTGGQMTPPILGSAAFIIAELTGTPYLSVAAASIIPAILYYLSIFYIIDLEAQKHGLFGLPRNQLPDFKRVILTRGHMILPVFVLIYVLVIMKASVVKAAVYAIYATFICVMIRKETRLKAMAIITALASGAKQSTGMISACATAGIVVGVLNLTGTGLKFASAVIAASGGHLPLALMFSMVAALILGMGLPTTAAYLICAAVIVPALIEMQVAPLVAHMFVFYFACLSAITPPVALAAFAASSISKAKPLNVAVVSVRLGLIAFIIPFMFVYAPSLLGIGDAATIASTIITATIGVLALGSSLQGLLGGAPQNPFFRACLFAGALCLIKPGIYTDIAGIVLMTPSIFSVVLHKRRIPQSIAAASPPDSA